MKIRSISLSWFRGAGSATVLETSDKSLVVYGANGAGKSSFSDAMEYMIAKGKLGHLMHEYSGIRQEKGTINTKMPTGKEASIEVVFADGTNAKAKIAGDGTPSFQSTPVELIQNMQEWEIDQVILRQDELAAFIGKTKGEKYSTVLPLLGLDHLEKATENLKKLINYIEEGSQLSRNKGVLSILVQEVTKYFPGQDRATAYEKLTKIAKKYGVVRIPPKLEELTAALSSILKQKVDALTPEITRHAALKKIEDENLKDKLDAMTKEEQKVIGLMDAAQEGRIEILKRAGDYIDIAGEGGADISCPACGRKIEGATFRRHVTEELDLLKGMRTQHDLAKLAREALHNSIKLTLGYVGESSVVVWLSKKDQEQLKKALDTLAEIDRKVWEGDYTPSEKTSLGMAIPIIVNAVKGALKTAPPSVQELFDDGAMNDAGAKIVTIEWLKQKIGKLNDIIETLGASEIGLRGVIKNQTEDIIKKTSKDIQKLWARIHPDEPIEDIKLYWPQDADKSIDVGLKFFGMTQPSPRLTLSEGHKNSLGLCIFLALASLKENAKRFIMLDDIITSLDRWHRGNVTGLLADNTLERQVLVFTHDREWFQELRVLLPVKDWKFLVLRPWSGPEFGLQWSTSEDTFDDARALIKDNCEAAGNCVRRIMDTGLALAAEKLSIQMAYARGDRNDHRTCTEFLEHIISAAEVRLRKRENGSWDKYPEAIEHWKEAHGLIVSWANRGSHTGSLVRPEVEKLIEAGEVALKQFKCTECGTFIWRADQKSQEIMQCECGKTQWKYG